MDEQRPKYNVARHDLCLMKLLVVILMPHKGVWPYSQMSRFLLRTLTWKRWPTNSLLVR